MKLSFWVFLMMTKVSSTNLLHKLGGVGDVLMAFPQMPPCTSWQLWGLEVNPWQLLLSVHRTCLKSTRWVFFKQNSSNMMICCTDMDVLCCNSLSFSRCCLIVFMAGSMGTDVNRALTSYEMMHSSGSSFMVFICSANSWVLWTLWMVLLPKVSRSWPVPLLCYRKLTPCWIQWVLVVPQPCGSLVIHKTGIPAPVG